MSLSESQTKPKTGGDPAVQPGLSVVIVNWNTRAKVLELCGDIYGDPSAYRRDVEVIVVDNHSSDGSVEAIRAAWPAVVVVAETANHGFAGGVNRGVAVATQPMVLLLNSDVRTDSRSIETLAAYAAEHREVGVLGPTVLNEDGTHQSTCWRDPSVLWTFMGSFGLNRIPGWYWERYNEAPWEEEHDVENICGCAFLTWRDLLREAGGLDEDFFMYYEETDLCRKVRRLGRKVRFVPLGKFVHEDGGTSKTVKLRTLLDMRRSELIYHRKHGGVATTLVARCLMVLGSAVRVGALAVLGLRPGEGGLRTREKCANQARRLLWLLRPTLIPEVRRG